MCEGEINTGVVCVCEREVNTRVVCVGAEGEGLYVVF